MVPMPHQPSWPWRALVTRFVTALAIISFAATGGLGYAYWFANDLVTHTKKRTSLRACFSMSSRRSRPTT
jgi:hypothetical protein